MRNRRIPLSPTFSTTIIRMRARVGFGVKNRSLFKRLIIPGTKFRRVPVFILCAPPPYGRYRVPRSLFVVRSVRNHRERRALTGSEFIAIRASAIRHVLTKDRRGACRSR